MNFRKDVLVENSLRSKLHTESVTRYARTDSAITLIALVITIIVLLILAGVSLNLVVGSNGIIEKANNAASETEKANAKEEIELVVANLKADYYQAKYASEAGESRTFLKYLSDEINKNEEGYTTPSGGKLTCTEDGKITYENDGFTFDMTITEEGGSKEETSADKTISTAAELKAFAEEVNAGNSYEGKTVVLEKDIDLSEVCGPEKGNWTPIGTETTPFKGTFDGKGKTISDLYIASEENNQGLFGYSQGNIKNIVALNYKINPENTIQYNTGAIVGYNDGGSILNCSVNNFETHSWRDMGGIVGVSKNGVIEQCVSKFAKIRLSDGAYGGIVGNAEGTTIKNCATMFVDIYGDSREGGIVGKLTNGVVENCYVSGNIESFGGLTGGIVGDNIAGTVSNCYSVANMINTNATCIIGWNTNGTIEKNYYVPIPEGRKGIAGSDMLDGVDSIPGQVEAKTAEQLKSADMLTLLGPAFKEDTNNINNGYPILSWQ